MPLYTYGCKCGHQFDRFLKIADRNEPVSEACPSCGETGEVHLGVSAPPIVSGTGAFHSKIPSGFKDRMKDIKKMSGRGCTIDV